IDGLGVEVMKDLLFLALYDGILLLDDSSSMRRKEKRKRIVEIKKICQKTVSVKRILRDATGVQAEFLNRPELM
ncbi:MAG: hypothetical protein M1835_002134, partial [Candelina submexicana]